MPRCNQNLSIPGRVVLCLECGEEGIGTVGHSVSGWGFLFVCLFVCLLAWFWVFCLFFVLLKRPIYL